MPVETKEIIDLKKIYKPWIKNGKLVSNAPQQAIDAYNQVMEWYYNSIDDDFQ